LFNLESPISRDHVQVERGRKVERWSNVLICKYRYPIPTIAWLNGHAFAGGLMTAMYHDYRVFNPTRGFLCLNELEFGAPLMPPMSTIFRQKCTPSTYRSLVQEAHRFNGPKALEERLVDSLGAWPEVMALVAEKKLIVKGTTGVLNTLRKSMFGETLEALSGNGSEAMQWHNEEQARREETSKRVEVWEARESKGNAKL
jgi:enoyl-CoA hydratase/carnithine racemase